MTVETATYISQLDGTAPNPATQPVAEGAQHISLVKSCLKATLPNWTAAPLNATQAQIDSLAVGISGVATTSLPLQAAAFLISGVQVGAPTGVDSFAGGGATTVTDAHGYMIATPGSGTRIFNLPTPVGRKGKSFGYRKIGATGVVYFQYLAGTIDGASAVGHTADGGMRTVVSDGAVWHTVSQYLAGI